jgi:hypothetical protein
MRSIKNIIKETLVEETNASIKVDDSNFFVNLINSQDTKKLFNFLLLFVAIVFANVFIITSFVFFINDILLFENTTKINSQGAIIPERSCGRESVLFLFNSSDLWANTGIQLQEDDKVKISISGGFHSDVANLTRVALENRKPQPQYEWTSFYCSKDTGNKAQYLYNKDDAYFGSILYQIAGEGGYIIDDSTKIGQLDLSSNNFFEIKNNGTLYLTVNDIYLSPKVLNLIESEGKEINSLKNNPEAYYEDNIGQILVVIDIERNLSTLNWKSSWYRYTERHINEVWDSSSNIFVKSTKTAGIFVLSICILIRKTYFISIPIISLILIIFIMYQKNFKMSVRKIKNLFYKPIIL